MAENYFKLLYDVDVSGKVKEKNGLSFLSWAAAWAEIKKRHPDATYKIYHQTITRHVGDENSWYETTFERPWFDDGRSGWVKTSVTVNGIEHIEELAIMNFSNKSIEAEKITSTDATKSFQRAITKACARHGIGLFVYEGEDLPEELKVTAKLQAECMDLMKKKSALSEKTKEKVAEICKEVLADENGDPRICEDNEKLESLKKKLLATRKIA